MGEDDGSGLAAGSDKKARDGWVIWPKFADPRSAGAARFVGWEANDSPLRRSVAGLKKPKANGWPEL